MGVDGPEEPRGSDEEGESPLPRHLPVHDDLSLPAPFSPDLGARGIDASVPRQRQGRHRGGAGTGAGESTAAGSKGGSDGASDSGSDGAPSGFLAEIFSGAAGDSDAPPGAGAEADVPPSDLELVSRMRGGESVAYEELYRRHAAAVRRYARSCCRDDHTAEDLTNEVFARTLQAVRSGAGPDSSVRAYLLTTVRRVAAAWGKTAKREQLVEDFAVFAASAAGASTAPDDDTLDLAADVLAMREAEHSLAVRAFRSLPERWQTVLWHTTVEEGSPSEVAPLLGLTANATAVLAHRAREGLKQAYLQAHVSTSLTAGGNCARYADRLGAFARGGLRVRAERGLRKHLEDCARCRTAALEVADVNERLRVLLPVAVIGWFAADFSVKAVAGLATGAAGAGTAVGAGAAAAASGTAGGAGAAGSGSAGGAGAGGGSGGAAAGEGLGAPAKIGIAAGAVVAAGAVAAYALIGNSPAPPKKPQAKATAAPVVPAPPRKPAPTPSPTPPPRPTPTPSPSPTPTPSVSSKPPEPRHAAAPKPRPTPTPSAPRPPAPSPKPTPPRPPVPKPPPKPTPPPAATYPLNEMDYAGVGDGTGPEIRPGVSSWLWQRYGLRIGGVTYRDGVSVNAMSSVTVDLNRSCTSYDALVGVDDMTFGFGSARFSVYGDETRLWRSEVVRGGEAAVPVHVPLAGHRTIRLVVEPGSAWGTMTVADWAAARFSCG
ncbi:sigma-70 family RNA polymerase sigma factor [Streptomyces sp. HU2014]|uniref:sigma-70 family RNA polymerase sigma factor n=1 Tax=Streptomyces sp. HU2014 TaxID=2939414 RepID=UPI00200E956B|nr:sigma-70 family RNA polymerase sigma factor [Streptomyces sp. HU2014]UQI42942.1 sigma-70 family RNA polymerase sigma factor [Streptomyces sp. HU2014]